MHICRRRALDARPSQTRATDLWIGPGARVISATDLDEGAARPVPGQSAADYSCGAAALAAILRYGFDDDVGEVDILKDLFGLLSDDGESVSRNESFLLLDFKRVAQSRTTSTDCLAWRTTRAAFGPSK